MTSPWLALEENAILRAGAGTGKTHALITLALGLLGGSRRGRAVDPEGLWILTFAEAAAAELRDRLRDRLAPLAAGVDFTAVEPELAELFRSRGRPAPAAAHWAGLLPRVAAVRASTLHGACAALLRAGGGVPSGFAILDAEEALELLRATVQEVVLERAALAGGLLEDLGYRGLGPDQQGLIETLAELHGRIADDGVGLPSPFGAPADVAAAARALHEAFAQFQGASPTPEVGRAVELLALGLARTEGALRVELEAAWGSLEEARFALGRVRKNGATEARHGFEALAKALGAARAADHDRRCADLLAEVGARYRAAKARRGCLDYADLCTLARDQLRDDRAARKLAKEGVQALLLDETQDTNRVQLEVCLLLSEARAGEAEVAPGRPVEAQVALEPGLLFAVGDQKQCIYEFRGANAAVFAELATALDRSGGRSERLAVSRRSHPGLVAFANGFFARALGEGAPAEPLDALRPEAGLPPPTLLALEALPVGDRREAPDPRTPVGLEATPSIATRGSPPPTRPSVEREAKAVAARAASLIREPPEALTKAVGAPLRPGHIALLFRRTTHVELFRAALAGAGLPSTVLGGQGFWVQPEILDASALLSALVDPGDAIAALTLLRSPLCGASDAALARAAFAESGRLPSLRRFAEELPAAIGDSDRERLNAFGNAFQDLRRSARGLGAAGLLRAAERELSLRARYADPQASANLDKLQGLLDGWQASGQSLPAIARRVARRVQQDPPEPVAPAAGTQTDSAVRLLTVHAAKGLEFPVVFVVDCGAVPRRESSPALYARGVGLAFKGRGPDGEWVSPASYQSVHSELRTRAAAEERRLLYVAATRARDVLFFSGELPRSGGKETWRALLDLHGAEAGLAVERISGQEVPPPPGPLFGEAPAPELDWPAALRDAAPAPRAVPLRLVLPASSAAELGLCARRYQLRQIWQVPERPGEGALPEELPPEDDPRALGSLAHRLLERVDLEVARRDLDAALARAAREVSRQRVDAEVLHEVRQVLSSPLGQKLLALPEGRVRREVPFVLRLGERPALVASGSIDLLAVLDDRVLVLDYKRGPPQRRASYEAQVRLYALAAAEMIGGALPIHAGLWFLREGRADPKTLEVRPAELQRLQRELALAAADVAGRDARRELFPGVEARRCRALGCGYLPRCHG